MRQGYTRASLPEYHDNKLIVQLRPQAVRMPRFGASAHGFESVRVDLSASAGLSALARFERQGQIKRVTTLDPGANDFIVMSESEIAAADASPRRASTSASLRRTAAATAGTEKALSFENLPNVQVDVDAFGPARAARAMLDSTRAPRKGALQGASLIELEKSSDVDSLQRALSEDDTVLSVSRVPIRYLMVRKPQRAGATKRAPSRPARAAPVGPGLMWNLRKIAWDEARAREKFVEATNIKVAVLDTGIDTSHPELKSRIKSYVFRHPDLPGASGSKDFIGHGTHVAGTIAANITNAIGIKGVCQCQLHIWKIFADAPVLFEDEFMYGYIVDDAMYLRALVDANDQEMNVLNLSIGGSGRPSQVELNAFADLYAGGTTVVAAMGNERAYGSPTSYPAAIRSVIAVGATTLHDRVAQFSNSGNHISVSAPGDKIWSTLPTYDGQDGFTAEREPSGGWKQGKPIKRERDYDAWSGTSMASPHVAAAAALYLARNKGASPTQVRDALQKSADKLPGMNGQASHPDYGFGRINLDRLL